MSDGDSPSQGVIVAIRYGHRLIPTHEPIRYEPSDGVFRRVFFRFSFLDFFTLQPGLRDPNNNFSAAFFRLFLSVDATFRRFFPKYRKPESGNNRTFYA